MIIPVMHHIPLTTTLLGTPEEETTLITLMQIFQVYEANRNFSFLTNHFQDSFDVLIV